MEGVKSTVNAAIEMVSGNPSIVLIYDPADEPLRDSCRNQLEGLGYDVTCCPLETAFSTSHVHHAFTLVVSNLHNDINVLELLQKFNDAEKLVGGVEGGIVTLSNAGFCRGKRVVQGDGLQHVVPVKDQNVVRDGNVVTGTTVSDTVRLLDDIYRGRQ